MDEKMQNVVLGAAQGVALVGGFRLHDAIRGKRAKTTGFRAVALHPGATFLHQIDFEWMSDRQEQKATMPMWQALSVGEAIDVLTPQILETMSTDIYDATVTEGFMSQSAEAVRKAMFHFVTPMGPVRLPLEYWQTGTPYSGQLSLLYDLSRSESA